MLLYITCPENLLRNYVLNFGQVNTVPQSYSQNNLSWMSEHIMFCTLSKALLHSAVVPATCFVMVRGCSILQWQELGCVILCNTTQYRSESDLHSCEVT